MCFHGSNFTAIFGAHASGMSSRLGSLLLLLRR
jgi:hypothetical protein